MFYKVIIAKSEARKKKNHTVDIMERERVRVFIRAKMQRRGVNNAEVYLRVLG